MWRTRRIKKGDLVRLSKPSKLCKSREVGIVLERPSTLTTMTEQLVAKVLWCNGDLTVEWESWLVQFDESR